ncbi:MAG: hypothetical protein OZ921_16935, partial [Sorangiineae bacterium]|nr:hypothetical protein [Sorangiineae bacterium]
GSAGDGSAGDGSAGDGSAGDGSAGDGSAGDGSAGDGSAGDGSAGDGSAGDGSTGDGSTGDGSTGDGSIMCPPPLVLCANACVDLDSDPLNCGSCGRFCPSGICEAGHCLGATAGHIALLCMSFEQNFQSSPQTTLLGNAVFLPVASPVRILTYGEYASNATRTRVNQALGWYASAKGRTFTLTAATSSADVQTRLAGFDYEVFLVYDEEAAPAGALGALGTAWASTLSDFLARGGVIVVTSGGGGRGEMSGLITSAGLLPVSAQRAATGTVLYNRAPADALGVNVLSPFLASRTSCTFETTATPSASTVFVVTDHAADGGVDSPAVIHRIP